MLYLFETYSMAEHMIDIMQNDAHMSLSEAAQFARAYVHDLERVYLWFPHESSYLQLITLWMLSGDMGGDLE